MAPLNKLWVYLWPLLIGNMKGNENKMAVKFFTRLYNKCNAAPAVFPPFLG